jgi:D-alanine-D-alanine ligase
MNKGLAKHSFELAGIKTPRSETVRLGDDIESRAFEIVRTLNTPYVVKPLASGSSQGVGSVDSFQELILALQVILENNPAALVEELIKGREITVGVVDSADSSRPHALMPIEVILPQGERIWGRSSKARDAARLVPPENLEPEKIRQAQAVALAAHEALGLRHYSRTDMILTPRGVFVTEVNSLPGLAENSPYAASLKAGGLDMSEFLDHIITLAHSGK